MTPAVFTRIRTSPGPGDTSGTSRQVRRSDDSATMANMGARLLPSHFDLVRRCVAYDCAMGGMIAGRTASEMPGLDIAEERSWQNFLDAALRLYGTLNRGLVDKHKLSLVDVRLLEILDNSETGAARMGILPNS